MITPSEYSVLQLMDAAYVDALYKHRDEQRSKYNSGKEAKK